MLQNNLLDKAPVSTDFADQELSLFCSPKYFAINADSNFFTFRAFSFLFPFDMNETDIYFHITLCSLFFCTVASENWGVEKTSIRKHCFFFMSLICFLPTKSVNSCSVKLHPSIMLMNKTTG